MVGSESSPTVLPEFGTERGRDGSQLVERRIFADRHTDVGLVGQPQVDARLARPAHDLGGIRHLHQQGVEERLMHRSAAHPGQGRSQPLRAVVDAVGDRLQTLGPVVDGVAGCHHREQHLSGADVRSGLLAADVLLTRLQRQTQRGHAVCVGGQAHQAARKLAFGASPGRDVAGVRAAVEQRHAEPLRGSDRDVGTPLSRRGDQRQRQQVGRGHHLGADRMRRVGNGSQLRSRLQAPVGRGGLHDDAEGASQVCGLSQGPLGDHDLDAQ